MTDVRDDDQLLTPGEAARLVSDLCPNAPLTADGLKLHTCLDPLRTAGGRRVYRRSRIEAFAHERTRAKADALPRVTAERRHG